MTTQYDYIIVGSGSAGGVLAHNLTKAGAAVLLLEAGKYFRKETFPTNEGEASAKLYWGGGFELSHDASMAFLRGKVVGGGSIVNQALMDRFDDVALADWRDESGVGFFSLPEMDPYYDKAEQMIALHTFEAKERNNNALMFAKGCEAQGIKWQFLRRAQDDCGLEDKNDCIACLSGCHRDSKQSTMVAYIRPAEELGLTVHDETAVTHFEEKEGGVVVYAHQNGNRQTYQAKSLILSAGAFGTTSLLLQNEHYSQQAALGKYFASHPQLMYFGIYDEPIDAHKGYLQTVNSKDPIFRPRGFKLENVFAGPATTALLFSGYGHAHQDIMMKYRYVSCAEVAIRDENAGEITVGKNGRLIVKKVLTNQDKKRMQDGVSVLKSVLASSGAKQVIESPFYFGLHLMGGCRMGVDATNSCVDPDFKLRGSNHIYVCDSSLFPNAPGINPALTIMALAHRLSEQLVDTRS